MENQNRFKTPVKDLARMQVVHFGKILFNLQFVALVIMVASILSFIVPALYYLVLLLLALITLFSLFANPTFRAFWSGGETLIKIASVLTASWKYTISIVIVLSVISIICLCFDKNKKHIARIVVSSVVLLFTLLILIIKLANSGVFQ